jgi:hypothetical protein
MNNSQVIHSADDTKVYFVRCKTHTHIYTNYREKNKLTNKKVT